MLEQLSWSEFLEVMDDFDADVVAMPDISTVCSASDWQCAAYEALHAPREYAIWRRGSCWFLGTVGKLSPFEQTLQPFELAWAFGSPLICPTPEEGADFILELLDIYGDQWQLAFLSGIPRHSKLQKVLMTALQQNYYVDQFAGAHCMQSYLNRDPEAFLSSRSARFRGNLRRSARRAQDQGITFEWHGKDDPISADELLQRAMEIEQRSWKFSAGSSIFLTERYRHFYRRASESMVPKGRLRALFARHEGQDIAYVFGGVMGHIYRGFQLSYDDEYAKLSPGHLVQWEMLQRLAAEDQIDLYDLGMAMEYKQRWSDHLLEIDNVAVFL